MIIEEVFVPINGYEGIYEISRNGIIRSVSRDIRCLLGKKRVEAKRKTKPRIKKQFVDIGGYAVVQLSNANKNYTKKVHVLVAAAFVSNPDNKPFVNHIDGNKLNNSVENLEWCTASENMTHAYKTGLLTIPLGENRLNAKFTNEQVKEIFHSASSAIDLAKKYNVHQRTIFSIKDGTNYSSVTGKTEQK